VRTRDDRGRTWATLAPKKLQVKRAGKVNPAADFYAMNDDEIL
jgi:hypothetical protein